MVRWAKASSRTGEGMDGGGGQKVEARTERMHGAGLRLPCAAGRLKGVRASSRRAPPPASAAAAAAAAPRRGAAQPLPPPAALYPKTVYKIRQPTDRQSAGRGAGAR